VYWASSLARTAECFCTFWAIMLLTHQVSIGFGLWLSAATSNPVIAAAMVPAVMTPMMLAGGFLASTDRLSQPALVWLERISTVHMPYTLMAHNEFNNVGTFFCDPVKYSPEFCAVQPTNGTQALSIYGLDGALDADWISWLTMGMWFIFLRFMTWLALVRSSGQKE